MEKIEFSTVINAPKETVWKVLWEDNSYRNWAGVFFEGSHAVTDWAEGSKVLFLGPDGSGMVSKIETKTDNEFMSFKHLGIVNNGIEDTDSEETKAWSGALENYTLKESNGTTTLTVDMDVTEGHKDYFLETWPKALEKIKALAEAI